MLIILSIKRGLENMGIKDKRSNMKWGRYSTALVLPALIEKGKESTLAADRLIILDPRGEIPEDDLLEFLENFIEPRFWPWLKEQRKKKKEGQ
jgi:hypothetical protein